MPPSARNGARKSPRDFTGIRGQQLAAEAAMTKAEEAQQVQEALRAQAEVKANTEVDYSSRPTVKRTPVEVDGELTLENVEVEVPTERIKVIDDIQEMTWGREVISAAVLDENGLVVVPPVLGSLRQLNFERGRWYTVDKELAEHLRFLGYVSE